MDANESALTPTPTTTPCPEALGPEAPFDDPSSQYNGTEVYDLSEAMYHEGSNLFVPLRNALVGLIKAGRRGDVCT